MKNKWGVDDDIYLVEYENMSGDWEWHMANDKGVSVRFIKSRVTRLKKSGAWQALQRLRTAEKKHMAEYFDALGLQHFIDESP